MLGDGPVGVFGEADERLGHAEESGADLLAVHFAVVHELEVGAGEGGVDDFRAVPEHERAVGGAGAVLAFAQGSEEFFALFGGELLIGADDDAGIAVVHDESFHELGAGIIGLGGEHRHREGREAAPEEIGIGQEIVDDFLGQKGHGGQRAGKAGAGELPAGQIVVVDDVAELVGVENQEIADCGMRIVHPPQ